MKALWYSQLFYQLLSKVFQHQNSNSMLIAFEHV